VHPQAERGEHEGEAEQQVLHRRIRDAPADDHRRVITDDRQAGEQSVHEHLEEQHDGIRRPERLAAQEKRAQYREVDSRRRCHAE
jgi:hypothetical protein